MKTIKQRILERLVLDKHNNITNLKLISLIKDYRNYAPRHENKNLYLKSYMNDGKNFIVQDGEFKGYYIWYTPFESTRFEDQKEFIWFTVKKDEFYPLKDTMVVMNTDELFKYLGETQVNNLYNFLRKKTGRE